MSEFSNLDFSIKNGIARIQLNRPHAGNTLNLDLVTELARVALLCEITANVKVVLLTGNGKMFCAGADLKAIEDFGDQRNIIVKKLADEFHKAISTFTRMKAPLIIAVNGVAAGGGFSFAVAGDLVLAAKSASFKMAYTASGLSPDGGSSYFLPRLIGLRRTQELMLTNRQITAQEAFEMGMITRVVPDEDLLNSAEILAQQISSGSLQANACVKRLLLTSFDNGLETQMELEGREISNNAMSKNGIEGICAFLEKRKPTWQPSE